MLLPSLDHDPRFATALAHFEAGDWLEASDLFEELFFEAVRDEIPIVRFLLQISTGMHHVARGQRRAAHERIEEGLRGVSEITSSYGVDLDRVCRRARGELAGLTS
jgi:predicted metal-dependent hydrolase